MNFGKSKLESQLSTYRYMPTNKALLVRVICNIDVFLKIRSFTSRADSLTHRLTRANLKPSTENILSKLSWEENYWRCTKREKNTDLSFPSKFKQKNSNLSLLQCWPSTSLNTNGISISLLHPNSMKARSGEFEDSFTVYWRAYWVIEKSAKAVTLDIHFLAKRYAWNCLKFKAFR